MSVRSVLYLDNNASTPLATPVLEAMVKCARCQHANPASPHQLGRKARHVVERVREEILADLGGMLSGTTPDRLIFTSGATEANNLAVRGMGRKGPVILSSVEHPSVERVGQFLIQEGTEVRWLSVNSDGLISLDQLEFFLRQGASLVSVIWANHETGVCQSMAKIGDLCRQYNIPLHTDATQIIAKKKIDLREIAVDALTFSSHKFHGPKGIGCLFVRGNVPLDPLVYGGFQQAGIRPGTESPVLVEGLWAAWKWAQGQREQAVPPLAAMRDCLENRLMAAFPHIVFHGCRVERSPQTSCFSLEGLDRQVLLMALDQKGIACSTGAACESGAAQRSATLGAMGCETSLLEAAIRLSVGYLNTPDEIDDAADRIINCINNLQRPSSLVSTAIPARREGSKMVD